MDIQAFVGSSSASTMNRLSIEVIKLTDMRVSLLNNEGKKVAQT